MNNSVLADQSHRTQALDVSRSFIVQAPAGSGKTELLSLRYLKLLAISQQPEEVLAITFTRKAASEMLDRIIKAIKWADQLDREKNPQLNSELENQRYHIASAVLQQSIKHNWRILENPGRLRVQTIDSFCHYLARQLPILSQLGGNPDIKTEMDECFIDAIRNTLAHLNSDTPLADHIAALLTHLDNNVGKVEEQLLNLLQNRDQWLSHIVGMNASTMAAKDYLQHALMELVLESITEVAQGLLPYENEIVELVNFAAENLHHSAKPEELQNFDPLSSLPEVGYSAIQCWLFIVNLLLTKDENWRKTVNVSNGFPSSDKNDKALTLHYKNKKQQHTIKV